MFWLPTTLGERRSQWHERRFDRQIYAPVLQLRGCYLADGATELARVFEVDGCDVANRATDDLLGRHIDLESHSRQDRQLGSRVVAIEVVGRIGFRKSSLLRFRESF